MQGLQILEKNSGTFDAIVIGAGMSGGWAAKELCEHGLKTLVLEKGRMVNHVRDYPTMNQDAWQMEHRGALSSVAAERQQIQCRSGFIGESSNHFFADDIDNPYQEDRRFDWIRGHQVGGRHFEAARVGAEYAAAFVGEVQRPDAHSMGSGDHHYPNARQQPG